MQPAAELLVITAAESNSAGETFSFFLPFFSCGYKLALLLHLKHHLLHIAASHEGAFDWKIEYWADFSKSRTFCFAKMRERV